MTFAPSNVFAPDTGSKFPPVCSARIHSSIKDLKGGSPARIPAATAASLTQGHRAQDVDGAEEILCTSAYLRSLADQIDASSTDQPGAAATVMDPGLWPRQLERFSQDLRAILKERNAARDAIKVARLEALQKLAAAAALKDDDTGQHVTRMGHFCAAIARALGAPSEYCQHLLVASRMHDVGKIGIPDAILKKPGKLTDEEWAVMRSHPQIGAALMGDTDDPLFNLAAEIALVHHEKFDGSGYPMGLRGENIPVSGRIVALADFFDAVTMDRCYRPAMTDEEALALVRQGEGKHFDPVVVDAFFKALDEIIDIRDRSRHGNLS